MDCEDYNIGKVKICDNDGIKAERRKHVNSLKVLLLKVKRNLLDCDKQKMHTINPKVATHITNQQ